MEGGPVARLFLLLNTFHSLYATKQDILNPCQIHTFGIKR
jgi:hypothetical protein